MFCSLSLLDRLHYGTQIAQIYFGSESFQGFGSSSSDPPVPLHICFHDEKAQTALFENFQACGVHPER